MLILGRNVGETIVINDNIFIKVVKGKTGNNFKLAIEAPEDVKIVRGELYDRAKETKAKWEFMNSDS